MDTTKLVKAIKSADRSASTMFDKCREAAQIVAVDYDPTQSFKDEQLRLMRAAKDAILHAKYIVAHRNVWQHISAALCVEMKPGESILVERKVKNADGNAETIKEPKRAEDLTTARDIREAAKQIRETYDVTTDGQRAGAEKRASEANRKARTDKAIEVVKWAQETRANMEALKKVFSEAGYSLAPKKKRASRKAEPVETVPAPVVKPDQLPAIIQH